MFEIKTDKSEAIKWFRRVLLAEMVLLVLTVIAMITLVETLPAELQTYIARQMESPVTSAGVILVLVFLTLFFFAIVGIWKFKNWARKLYLILVLAGILFFFVEPVVMNSWEALFATVAAYLDAFILFAMFFVSPIKEQFQAQND